MYFFKHGSVSLTLTRFYLRKGGERKKTRHQSISPLFYPLLFLSLLENKEKVRQDSGKVTIFDPGNFLISLAG